VTITITDNDMAGVAIAPTALAVSEGGSAESYSVVLLSQPTAEVEVLISADSQLSTDATTLTFTNTDWNTPQTVSVLAVDDDQAEGSHSAIINHQVSSADPAYNAFPAASVSVSITDNDGVGVIIAPLALSIAEGGPSAGYSVALSSQPLTPVTITVATDDQLSASSTVLVFNAANWASALPVSVSAVDDAIAEGEHVSTITHAISTSDPDYAALPVADVTVTIADNDSAAVLINPVALAVAEGGAGSSYSVVLGSQPTANVVVAITVDDQVTTNLAQLTFTPASWDSAQTVIVSAVDDALPEPPHSGAVSHLVSSSDPFYSGLAAATVTVSISDNDAEADASHVFFPIMLRNFDASEPNDTCATAYAIEPNRVYEFLPDDLNDWYQFDLVGTESLVVALTSFEPGAGQVAVYRGDSCAERTFLGSNGSIATEKLVFLGTQTSGHYYVYVSNDGTFSDKETYELEVRFR
jgi:hypothetical protein